MLSDRVGKCDALLAVIGKQWVASPDGQNRRRLDDPNDFVRIEIEAALQRDVPVIPVLVDGAPMPQSGELPDSLKKLTRRQAIEISLTRFDSDAERLTDVLSQLEDELRQRDAAGGEPTAPTVAAEAAPRAEPERGAPEAAERPIEARTAAARPAGANVDTEPSRPEAPLPASPKRARLRLQIYLALLGLGVIGGGVFLLAKLGSQRESPAAGAYAPGPGNVVTAAPAVAPALRAFSPDEWLTRDDFQAEFNQKSSMGYYPDVAYGRCEDGVAKCHAHWVQRPPGFHFSFQFGWFEANFNAKKLDLTSQGYAVQYQNTFRDCNGLTRYQALWTKSE